MRNSATTKKIKSLFNLRIVEKEISFNEEKLSEFKSVQISFKDFITDSFALRLSELNDSGQVEKWQPDLFTDGNDFIQCKNHIFQKEPGYLDNFIQVLLAPDLSYGFKEAAEGQIAGFENFVTRRLNGSFHGVGEKESKLICKVQLAIKFYNEYNCHHFYNKFKLAIAEYFIWLERKIYKSTIYIICLSRYLSVSGILVDFRQLLRAIMRFFCKRLDDEHIVYTKIHNLFSKDFYRLTCVNYEFRIYKRYN